MILTTLALVTLAPQAAPVSLGRVFTKGEFLSYAVRSGLHAERRMRGLQTWIPMDLDINYEFTTEVEALKTDGIAVVHYKRPTVTEIEGETFDHPPVKKTEKVNFDLRLTVSPFNELLEMKDLSPKKPEKKKSSGTRTLNLHSAALAPQLGGVIGQFVSEVYRLSLFVGNFESALDFAPRTTFDKVAVGDTWKRTVGYQPQKLKGKGDKQAVQRLDFTYTYKGIVGGAKGKVMRVEGKMSFSTDLADFINQTFEVDSSDTGLKSVPLALETTIEFDLDPVTHHTLAARATSNGSYKLLVSEYPDDPVLEEKITGHTNLKLAGRKIVAPIRKKQPSTKSGYWSRTG